MKHRVQRRFSIARDDGKKARTGEEDQRYPGSLRGGGGVAFSVPGTVSTSDGPSLLPVLKSSRTANVRHRRVSLAHQEQQQQTGTRKAAVVENSGAIRRRQFVHRGSSLSLSTRAGATILAARQRVLSRPLVCSRESEKRRDRASEVPAVWREKGSTPMLHASARALTTAPG